MHPWLESYSSARTTKIVRIEEDKVVAVKHRLPEELDLFARLDGWVDLGAGPQGGVDVEVSAVGVAPEA